MFFKKRGGMDVLADKKASVRPLAPKKKGQDKALAPVPAPTTFLEDLTQQLFGSWQGGKEVQPLSVQDNASDAAPAPLPEDSEPLTLTSAIALVAGTTVGAGILALPAFTIRAGFLPSSTILIGAWLYMVTTGLLIAEVNLNLAGKSHRPDGGIIAMAGKTIGSTGASVAGVAYAGLHYALLVAYIAQGGDILTSGLQGVIGGGVELPRQLAPVLFTATLGGALAFGNKKWLDQANDALVGVVVLTFLGLVALAGPRADPSALLHADWSSCIASIPVMFVALVRTLERCRCMQTNLSLTSFPSQTKPTRQVYHNIIPVISYRLKGDAEKIRTSVVVGSGIPLLMFLAWNAVVLGNIAPSVVNSVAATGAQVDPLAMLRAGGAGEGLGKLISVFSEVAIVTSFTGFVYGLKDFLKDVLFSGALARSGNRHLSHNQDMLAYLLILAPPLVVAVLSPDIFFSALDNAGAFGICVLFGIIPAAMAGIVRHRAQGDEDYLRLVPGGNAVLGMVGLVATFVIVQKAMELFG